MNSILKITADKKQQAVILCLLAHESRHRDANFGLRYAMQALEIGQQLNDSKSIAAAYQEQGVCYTSLAQYPKALACYFKALSIYEDLKDEQHTSITTGCIGWVYYQNDADAQALAYQQKAYIIAEKNGDNVQMAKMLSDMGVVEMDLGTKDAAGFVHRTYLDKASMHFRNALKLNKAFGKQEDVALVLGNIGNLELRRKNYPDALSNYQEALRSYKDVGNKQGIARNLGNIAEVYKTQYQDATGSKAGNKDLLNLAISNYQQAIDTAIAIRYLEAVWFYSGSLSDALHLAGRDAEALSAYQQFKQAQDSMSSADARTQLAQLQADRDLRLKDKQIIIDRLAVAKKRNERVFFIAGILLLGAVIFFIARERKRSDMLLLNILPAGIAARLKKREHPIADHFAEASIMFVDIAGFTIYAERRDPKETVTMLNAVFTEFDALAEKWGLEKIKTIGDCYMAVAGVPKLRAGHADAAAGMALDIQRRMKSFEPVVSGGVEFRIGLDCGPVVAGVIGRKKFIYDLWGDAVNTASRMESTGLPGRVHCTERYKNCLAGKYTFTGRGAMNIKGKGAMETWLIDEAAGEA